MRAYTIRRLLLVIPTVFLATLIIFIMMRLIPASIVDLMVAAGAGFGQPVEAKMSKPELEKELGLDVPIYTQYGRWIGVVPGADGSFNGILQGNLGVSLWDQQPVTDMLKERWPVTLELCGLALIIAVLVGLPIGIYSALQQDTMGDYIARSFSIAAMAVPGFWLATLVIVFPSIWWGYMPPIVYTPFTEDPIANLKQFILPALVLAGALSGIFMRTTRTMMLEVLRQDYIRTAWAKGLRERVVIIRHALKNALIPVVTMIGLNVPLLIGGEVIIEQIFCLPGMGRLILDATLSRDYPLVSGIMLLFAFGVVLINLIVDLSYGFLDPRVHYK